MSFVIASSTALVEPGIANTTLPCAMPPSARLSIAPLPICSQLNMRNSSPNPGIDLVTSGAQDGLISVRRFLDAARGGLYMAPNAIDRELTPYTDAEVVFV